MRNHPSRAAQLLVLVALCCFGPPASASSNAEASAVALGRLRPAGGVALVAAPYSLQGPSLIRQLLVEVGQRVTNGQPLALTHMHAGAQSLVAEARAAAEVSRARLAIVESGLKPGEIAALAADAEEQDANFSEAAQLLERANRLRRENVISPQELDNARARWLAASNRVLAARQRLAAGSEVRKVDIALARAEVALAEATVERAKRELEQTRITAPFAGEVLALRALEGELATQGLLELGRTDAMEVLAEVYESDVGRVFPGQAALIEGDAFKDRLTATVAEIRRQVRPNRLLNPDPAAFADNRVVEAILRVENSRAVSGLSGALVRVHFLP